MPMLLSTSCLCQNRKEMRHMCSTPIRTDRQTDRQSDRQTESIRVDKTRPHRICAMNDTFPCHGTPMPDMEEKRDCIDCMCILCLCIYFIPNPRDGTCCRLSKRTCCTLCHVIWASGLLLIL